MFPEGAPGRIVTAWAEARFEVALSESVNVSSRTMVLAASE
jgi:hypothetical protein